jgi:hypothetical protein
LIKERCGGVDSNKIVRVDKAWVATELDLISKFVSDNDALFSFYA